MQKRVQFLDYLRILAILSIIMLHCITIFRYKYFLNDNLKFFAMTFLDSFTRFGVPAFFMITGALMFSKKDESYDVFFKKRVMKLLIPYIFFSGVYFIYQIIIGEKAFNAFEFIREVTSFHVEYHLWFMPVMILIYLGIPFLKKLANFLEQQELKRMITIIFILGNVFIGVNALSSITGYPLLSSFTLPNLMIYTNYLFLGYYLYHYDYRLDKKTVFLTIISILLMPVVTFIISRTEIKDTFMDSISLFVIYPAIFIFTSMKNSKNKLSSKLNKVITYHSNNVLYVYLIHVLFLSILEVKLSDITSKTSFLQDIGLIFLLWIIVTVLSFVFAFIWTKLKQFITKNYEKISNILIQILSLILLGIIVLIVINLLLNPYHFIKLNYLGIIIGIPLLVGLFIAIYKYQNILFRNRWVNLLFVILYFLLQLIIIYCFMVEPSWDFGEVYKNAVEFAKSSHPTFGNAYLYMCDNNIVFSVILDCIFKFFYWIGLKDAFLQIGIGINLLMIDISLIYLYKLLKLIKEEYAKPFILFCMMFSPLLFYLPIFYTDTLTLPFLVIPLYYFYNYFFVNQKVRYIMISGLLLGFGGVLKPTVLILLIAVILFLILKKEDLKRINYYKTIPILLLLVVIPILGQKVFINHFFDKSSLALYRIPTTHYIWIGLEGDGGYTEEAFQRINKELGQDARNKLAVQGIKERINKLVKENKILSFYNRKISYTWTDGTFFAREKLRRKPIHEEYTKLVFSDKKEDTLYWSFSNSEWMIVLLLLFSGILFRKHLPKDLKDFSILLMISIFGIFLFLLIWETRSRYLVNFVPLLLVSAYIGIIAIANKIKDRRIK